MHLIVACCHYDMFHCFTVLLFTLQCPFARLVFKFHYKNVEFLHKLQTVIAEMNAAALGLQHLSPHVLEAALSTYKLSL